MDESKVKQMRERLLDLSRQSEALAAEAGDFPAVARNAARIQASLAMIKIDLGMITVPDAD